MSRRITSFGIALASINLALFLSFIALRAPIPVIDLQERDTWKAEIRRSGGIGWAGSNVIWGRMAGRYLYNWAPAHGGENFFVMAGELANLPSFLCLAFASIPLEVSGLSYQLSTKAESWLYAFLFLATSSLQWLLVGYRVHYTRISRASRAA